MCVQVRAGTGETGSQKGSAERLHDRTVLRGRRAGPSPALRARLRRAGCHAHIRRSHAGRAAFLRLRQGPLHGEPAVRQCRPDRCHWSARFGGGVRDGEGCSGEVVVCW
ncbi:Vacuolar iron transporter 1 [Zea mays]|uniref:Vacuolar iron transporter 1 n=1 Tax=Zea mays TaxID=4577 RepID=A0A1D6J859_MAIZE|nr:Vacuolar iron transporter 1 [Zea mays]